MLDEFTRLASGIFLGSAGLLYWPFALAYLLIAALVLARREPGTGRSPWRALFPAEVYGHASFRTDLKVWFVTLVLTRLGMFGAMYAAVAALATASTEAFRPLFADVATGPVGLGDRVAFTLVSIVLFDLGYFLGHRASHRWPLLWSFHRVHHAAEHLNPLTAGRLHPIDYLVTSFLGTLFGALATSAFTLWHGTEVQPLTIANLSIVYALFLVLAHFRHSHVGIDFGPRLSRVLVSPSMHQLHHSRESRHFDRNFGLIFSFWDRLFGSLAVPRRGESYRFGLDDPRLASDRPLANHLLMPFSDAARRLRRPRSADRRLAKPGAAGRA